MSGEEKRGPDDAPPDEVTEDHREDDGEAWDEYDRGARSRAGGTHVRRIGIPVWWLVTIAVLGLAIAYSLLRIAGEQHYQSCIAAASARTGNVANPLTQIARLSELKGCTRSPF